ncbi:hypothetical protein [Micromonospora sp. LOL_023]|uniref:hypothetical protein n=1 Tax=Micromonospora sp. LOL_023 TaxID=3345418 RepID=UPI003A88D980
MIRVDARRQAVQERAVAMFVEDRPTAEFAPELRVSEQSVWAATAVRSACDLDSVDG